jgi:hypothetical protein
MAVEANPPEHLKCVKAEGARGHFRSVKVLAKASIWTGYAAPDKHNVSFQGFLSFEELKENRNNRRSHSLR